jgi:hypothetical protein
MKDQPDKYVVIRREKDNPYSGVEQLVYGPELKERCQHWIDQLYRLKEASFGPVAHVYEIRKATISWT